MIQRIAAKNGRWYPALVVESTPKQMRQGATQYTAFVRDIDAEGMTSVAEGDTIEEAVDNAAG